MFLLFETGRITLRTTLSPVYGQYRIHPPNPRPQRVTPRATPRGSRDTSRTARSSEPESEQTATREAGRGASYHRIVCAASWFESGSVALIPRARSYVHRLHVGMTARGHGCLLKALRRTGYRTHTAIRRDREEPFILYGETER